MRGRKRSAVRKVFQATLLACAIGWQLQAPWAYALQSGCSSNPLQTWDYVDPTRPVVTTTGTIHSIERDSPSEPVPGGTAGPGWHIRIDPDDKSVVQNRRSRDNADGLIELEVQSGGRPASLPKLFPVGARVEACGEWVEDMGQDPYGGINSAAIGGRTELHPLHWLRSVATNPALIFIAQDDSGRFGSARNPLWERFEIPVRPQFPKVTPWRPVPSRTLIFAEEAGIARGTSSAAATPSGYSLWVYLDGWWFNDCGRRPPASCGDACGHSPYYFGTVRQSTVALLAETVTYRVGRDAGTGRKIVYLQVAVELGAPPQGPLAYTRWTYESGAGDGAGVVEEVKRQPPHRLELALPYAPALGYAQNSWRLSVAGSTVPQGQHQPPTSSLSTEHIVRMHIAEGRTYALDPSTISLDRAEVGDGVCGEGVRLAVNESKLLPQIALSDLQWTVRVLRDAAGSPVASPEEIGIAADAPTDGPGFTARVAAAGPGKRLEIAWTHAGPDQRNLSRIAVVSRGVTELGEAVEACAVLSPACGLGPYRQAEILDYNYRLLARRGLRGKLDTIARMVAGNDKKWLEALVKFVAGTRIGAAEEQLLIEKARLGAELPPLPANDGLPPPAR